tara:strand:- start:157 stop:348 length:192 start_codon:yes stop_codon:yes gene_type:complete
MGKNVDKLKERMAASVMKHPVKWGAGLAGLGLAKFAVAGWALSKVGKSKKKKEKELPKKYMAG